MSLNKVLLIGNAGRDPEVRHLEGGVAVVTLAVATTERFKDKNGLVREQTEWHNVVFWRGLAETVEKNVRKGSPLFIEGRLRTRSWEDQGGLRRYTTEIVADSLRLLDGRGSDNISPQQGSQSGGGNPAVSQSDIRNDATEIDDLPF